MNKRQGELRRLAGPLALCRAVSGPLASIAERCAQLHAHGAEKFRTGDILVLGEILGRLFHAALKSRAHGGLGKHFGDAGRHQDGVATNSLVGSARALVDHSRLAAWLISLSAIVVQIAGTTHPTRPGLPYQGGSWPRLSQ